MGKKSSRYSITPSTGGLLAQISPRANESLRGGFSSSGEAVKSDNDPVLGSGSPLELAKVSRVALGDLKLTDRPFLNLFSVFTVSEGFADNFWLAEKPVAESFSFVGDLLFANGIAKRPSSESSSSESSCGIGERWKETLVSSKSNSGPKDLRDCTVGRGSSGTAVLAGDWLVCEVGVSWLSCPAGDCEVLLVSSKTYVRYDYLQEGKLWVKGTCAIAGIMYTKLTWDITFGWRLDVSMVIRSRL